MAQKTRATINSEILTKINDNTTGDITPTDVREVTQDILDSALNMVGVPGAVGSDILPVGYGGTGLFSVINKSLYYGAATTATQDAEIFISTGTNFKRIAIGTTDPSANAGGGYGFSIISPTSHAYSTLRSGGTNTYSGLEILIPDVSNTVSYLYMGNIAATKGLRLENYVTAVAGNRLGHPVADASFIYCGTSTTNFVIGTSTGNLKFNNTATAMTIAGNAVSVQVAFLPPVFTTAPTGVEGRIYYDSVLKKHYGHDGTTWQPFY